MLEPSGPRVARVTAGAVGPVYTEITSGLTAGDRVILADLGQPIPSAITSNRFGRTGTGLTGGTFVGRNGVPGAGGGGR